MKNVLLTHSAIFFCKFSMLTKEVKTFKAWRYKKLLLKQSKYYNIQGKHLEKI
jgi:hypothetical protein